MKMGNSFVFSVKINFRLIPSSCISLLDVAISTLPGATSAIAVTLQSPTLEVAKAARVDPEDPAAVELATHLTRNIMQLEMQLRKAQKDFSGLCSVHAVIFRVGSMNRF